MNIHQVALTGPIPLLLFASTVDIVSPAANEVGLEHGRSKARSRGRDQTGRKASDQLLDLRIRYLVRLPQPVSRSKIADGMDLLPFAVEK